MPIFFDLNAPQDLIDSLKGRTTSFKAALDYVYSEGYKAGFDIGSTRTAPEPKDLKPKDLKPKDLKLKSEAECAIDALDHILKNSTTNLGEKTLRRALDKLRKFEQEGK